MTQLSKHFIFEARSAYVEERPEPEVCLISYSSISQDTMQLSDLGAYHIIRVL